MSGETTPDAALAGTGAGLDFGMTEIEERLRADADGSDRAALVEMLAATRRAVEAEVASGLSPTDFDRAQAILISLDAASELVLAFR